MGVLGHSSLKGCALLWLHALRLHTLALGWLLRQRMLYVLQQLPLPSIKASPSKNACMAPAGSQCKCT